jgi:ubiquinone/menaquinone biosynthesis C-methylase UbiE
MTCYFDQAYRDYRLQNPARKLDHYLDVIDTHVPPGPKSLLDIGCGLGAFVERAAERHPDWSLAATDIDIEAVAETRRQIPKATILMASAEEAPFTSASFDVITAWDVFEHVPDVDAAARSVTHMLKPGGLLVFVVPVYDGVTGPLIRRLDKDPTHVHKLSRATWVDWARDRFGEVEWHGLLRYLVGRTYIHITTARLRRHTPAILVSCRLP